MHIVSYSSVNDAKLINEWERFVKFGIKPKSIDRNIASSWARSKDLGINPYKCVQRAEINEKELQKRISLKESYLNIITPYLEKIHRAISGEGYLLYYADELGNVLHIVADDADLSFSKKIFILKRFFLQRRNYRNHSSFTCANRQNYRFSHVLPQILPSTQKHHLFTSSSVGRK